MGNDKSGTKGLHRLGMIYNWHCAYCGARVFCAHCHEDGSFDRQRLATKDHILPKHAGGTDAWSNLALACARCNRHKGHLVIEPPITWAKIQRARFQKQREDAVKYGDLRRAARAKQRSGHNA